MNNIFFNNFNKDLLSKYDGSFKNTYMFENELCCDDKKYTLLRKKRYIVNKDILNTYNIIYISYIEQSQTPDGILLTINDKKILLIKVSDYTYYLASINNHKIDSLTLSMLYTFISDNDCIIDITKYHYAFKHKYIPINLYK